VVYLQVSLEPRSRGPLRRQFRGVDAFDPVCVSVSECVCVCVWTVSSVAVRVRGEVCVVA
jgi:hypothetical protein